MTVAARVAEEMGTQLGREVGYSIRFEDLSTPVSALPSQFLVTASTECSSVTFPLYTLVGQVLFSSPVNKPDHSTGADYSHSKPRNGQRKHM